ncbi:c-type cytochrome domain-containing protein [uncultured Psychroserpens sp.]|uniref:c-type cytochrome domain-containing protein n=1 Tax=uncultured Psychroserpens sp. TaxID=255436 RepID=UPI0026029D0D|nr:c-type cytochrome domain-containing protein [uncultured Psychroserpens sp.]
MTNNNQIYKSVFLIVLLLFGVLTLYGIKTDEAPRFILALGRFHPLLLHLPIGALIVTFFIDVLGRFQKNYPENTIKSLLGFTSLFAIITCFLGYFLSLEGGYQKETLDLHFYTGIATALLAVVLFFMSLKPSFKSSKIFLPLFIATVISISVAGHYGSVLTHGDQYLIEYISVSKKERTIEDIDSLKLYNDVVVKILDKKCIQCHNASKQKGELSLVTKEQILKGGASGLSVISGNASESLLYSRVLLPISDEEHMPPEGKEQLTKDEIWLIEHWIENGLDFENYATANSENDTLKKKLNKYLVFNKVNIPKASQDDIDDVKAAGFRVLELVPGQAELNVKYLDSVPTKNTMEALLTLDEQIIELDFSNSGIIDEMTSGFKKFKNLKSLRLQGTAISDKTIENLKALEHLEVLNIHNTAISEEGLENLLTAIQPKRIYSWNTNVDNDNAQRLANTFGISIQNDIVGFVDRSQLEPPLISPSKTLFNDTIHVNVLSRLKNVEIRYTLNGDVPDSTSKVFDGKLILNTSKTLKVVAFKDGWEPSDVITRHYAKVQYAVTDFIIEEMPDDRYPDPLKVFDMKEGSTDFRDGHWIGYFGNDMQVTIDLKEKQTVNHISVSCLEDIGSWILYPTDITVFTSATKNGIYKKVGDLKNTPSTKNVDPRKEKFTIALPETTARYFKIVVNNHDALPSWHPSAGNPSWLFVDEVYFW